MKVRFNIIKGTTPAVFIDTFMWKKILDDSELKGLLIKACKKKKILVILTSTLCGELRNRNLLDVVKSTCKDSYIYIPNNRIFSNEVRICLISYLENKEEVNLDWEEIIKRTSLISESKKGLKDRISYVVNEINKLPLDKKKDEFSFIPEWICVEKEIWKNFLLESFPLRTLFIKDFLNSEYFLERPFMLTRVYLLVSVLKEKRNLEFQDFVDICNISEVIPYTTLSIVDKAQHNRLKSLKNRYPLVFKNFYEHVYITSEIKRNERYSPKEALISFINYCLNG